MASYAFASPVAMPGTRVKRSVVRVSPSLFYCVKGVRISDGGQETWVSKGTPDLRAGTHAGAVILGQWYQE